MRKLIVDTCSEDQIKVMEDDVCIDFFPTMGLNKEEVHNLTQEVVAMYESDEVEVEIYSRSQQVFEMLSFMQNLKG